jgi:SHS2 domain-containing protein
MRRYEVLTRRPLVIRAFGATLEELFEHAAYAVFDQGYRVEDIAPTYSRPVLAAGDAFDVLLANWLEELLAMSRAEGIVPSYFVVDRLEEGGVQGSAAGLPVADASPRQRKVVAVSAARVVEHGVGAWAEVELETRPHLGLVH